MQDDAAAVATASSPRSVYTESMAVILEQLDISLVVSTYQAGQVILVRRDGRQVNTGFQAYDRPMGIAVDENRLAIGSTRTVWTLHDMPGVARKLDPPGRYDACYLTRQMHVTGDIDIHEMAYDDEHRLWLVNTRFGCLCTLDADHSFYPRWKPPFLSAYAAEDRCHLNGLAMREGKPKYVTALGETDTAGGWRANKATGGILMDIEHDAVLLRGLSMPHSPRWYQDGLWLLESGRGTIARADLDAGNWRDIARLPGFTRGLDFYGPLAFIGLSQVRESAQFSGIPIVDEAGECSCGIWVVDLRNGETVAFLRFESVVQEIFAVQVLANRKFPEILGRDDPRLDNSYVLPDKALAMVVHRPIAPRPGGGAWRNDPAAPVGPETSDGAYRRALALRDRGDIESSIAAFETAAELDPERAEVWTDLADAHASTEALDAAIECYERALALRPDDALIHIRFGKTLLRLGSLTRGFAELEWRLRGPDSAALNSPQPRWDGGSLTGKRLLVYTEPGARSAIQYLRFLPEVASEARSVILVAPPDLLGLFRTARGIDQLQLPDGIDPATFDLSIPLGSLPALLGTSLDSLPAELPYLAPPRERKPLPPPAQDAPLKVGLVWSESQGQPTNTSPAIPAIHFRDLLDLPGVSYYSLQAGEGASDIAQLQQSGSPVHDLSAEIESWADCASFISQLDLVIGTDTAELHLAGALAKPAWILLGESPDWTWLQGREDSPWYPTLRLFRQQPGEGWPALMQRLREALVLVLSSMPDS